MTLRFPNCGVDAAGDGALCGTAAAPSAADSGAICEEAMAAPTDLMNSRRVVLMGLPLVEQTSQVTEKSPNFVILSEAKNLSFFDFAGTWTEERFFASLRM